VADIDGFASQLLEESKRFLERAKETENDEARQAYLHACVLLSFSSLEAHVNSIIDEFGKEGLGLTVHELALLIEREVVFDKGSFRMSNSLKMSRIKDRILLLIQKFGRDYDASFPWTSRLGNALELRNRITHPKNAETIEIEQTAAVIQAVIEVVDFMFQAIYRKGLPAAKRGLQSKLTF
jgi:hypothetical protein